MIEHVHGGDVYRLPEAIDFSANLNPFGMPVSVKQAAKNSIERSVCYPDVHCRKLKEVIGRYENIPEDWIVCGNGAADIVFALTLAKKPKRALLLAPSFAEYEKSLRTVDCLCDFHYLKEEDGFALKKDYLTKLTKEVDIVFLCNPNNPTGLVIPREENTGYTLPEGGELITMQEILSACKEQDIFLAVDECFNEFLTEAKKASVTDLLGEYPNLFILKAFTKTYGMPGLRLGYGLCSDKEVLNRISEVTQPWNVSVPAQAAGIAALKEKDFLKQSVEYISRERERLKQGISEAGCILYGGEANYLFFYTERKEFGKEMESRGILVRDCKNYRGLREGFYRIAVRTEAENEKFLDVLKQIQVEDKK